MSVENRKLDDSGSWKVDFKKRKMNLSVQLMDSVCVRVESTLVVSTLVESKLVDCKCSTANLLNIAH